MPEFYGSQRLFWYLNNYTGLLNIGFSGFLAPYTLARRPDASATNFRR